MKATTGHIDEAADRAINERVVQQHPHMKPVTARPTTQCVYEGAPAVTVRTGDLGNRFGLCAECATAHDTSVTARRILDQLEIDRAEMQTAGKSTPAYEEFVDHLAAIISYTPDPAGALGIVRRLLTRERTAQPETAWSGA